VATALEFIRYKTFPSPQKVLWQSASLDTTWRLKEQVKSSNLNRQTQHIGHLQDNLPAMHHLNSMEKKEQKGKRIPNILLKAVERHQR
jgi:hypothetical protein